MLLQQIWNKKLQNLKLKKVVLKMSWKLVWKAMEKVTWWIQF